ncbi:MAG: hypothetical protein DRO89_03160 [Candidatus Altiarchaeales archaeon]|nr:MAG: hypothetical protein DRO89_03160 [Candidatus Altiarchaeales archaeon]
MLCPRCGRKSYGLCIDCFLEENPVKLRDIKLSLCTCGNYLYRGRWSRKITDSIERIVEKNLIVPSEIRLKGMRVLPRFRGSRIDLEIWVSGLYGGREFRKKFDTSIEIERRECPECSKLSSDYYEAVIQFRTKKPVTDLDLNPRFISKIKRVRGGFDLYVISSGYARQLRRRFDDLGFQIRESSKLVGKKNGKNVYRISISIEEPDFEEGDFLRYGGDIIQVLRRGKRSICRNIVNKKRKTIPISNLRGYKPIAKRSDLREGVVTMVSPGGVQVLDLKDNKTYELKNETLGLEPGQEIDILKIGKGIYIL